MCPVLNDTKLTEQQRYRGQLTNLSKRRSTNDLFFLCWTAINLWDWKKKCCNCV